MAALPGFNEPDAAVGDVYNGYEIVEVINAGAGRYAWESITEFKSVADLASTSGLVNGRAFKTKGYYTAGDGGGQELIYRSTGKSGITVDNGFYFAGPGADDYFEAVEKTHIYAKRFGAKGDGSTNDQARLQAAIEVARSTFDTGTIEPSGEIILDAGNYVLNSPLLVKSGVTLRGVGPGTRLVKGGSFSGAALIVLSDVVATYCQFFHIQDLAFHGDVMAITDETDLHTIHGSFDRLFFNCTNGIVLTEYVQSCSFNDLFSYGDINKFLHVNGNNNEINRIVKEGGSGSSTDPYILLSATSGGTVQGWLLRSVLLEGAGSVNKTPLKIQNAANVEINNFWCETTVTNGFMVEVDNSTNVLFHGLNYMPLEVGVSVVKITDSTNVVFDNLDVDSIDQSVSDVLEITNSTVFVNNLYASRGKNTKAIEANGLTVGNVVARSVATLELPGISSVSKMGMSGSNMLVNPSFEAGNYGWSSQVGGGATLTETVSNAEVAPGKMMRLELSALDFVNYYQIVAITSGMVGKPFTLSFAGRINSGTNPILSPLVYGCGLDTSASRPYPITTEDSWFASSMTVTPSSAGSLWVGVQGYNVTSIDIDLISFVPGTEGTLNTGSYNEIQVGDRIITRASAKPTGGTWRVGDLVLNSAPSSTAPLAWVCTTAGSPGTWQGTVIFDVGTWRAADAAITGFPVVSQYDSTHSAGLYAFNNQAGLALAGGAGNGTLLFQFGSAFFCEGNSISYRDEDGTVWLQYVNGSFIRIGRAGGYPLEFIGGLVKPNLPTSSPGAGYLWNDGGTVKVGT